VQGAFIFSFEFFCAGTVERQGEKPETGELAGSVRGFPGRIRYGVTFGIEKTVRAQPVINVRDGKR